MKKLSKISSLVLALSVVPMAALADVPITGVTAETPAMLDGQTGLVNSAVGILQWIGYAVAIVMVLWLGIQWMIAQPAKKAELKGKMWSMAIGILLLVGGVTFIGIVWGGAENIQAGAGL